jgi:DNA segregation ATPase FtsK/SpoIIIE-like protein
MNNLISTIIKAGLIVGTLDILSAFLYYFIRTGDKNVFIVLKAVAGGLFGKKAFSGGNEMLIAGLILHFIIAFAFTIFFFWLFPK